jgi:hypothetical protein
LLNSNHQLASPLHQHPQTLPHQMGNVIAEATVHDDENDEEQRF